MGAEKFTTLIQQNPCYPVFGSENIDNRDFIEFVRLVASSGVKVLQLREKNKETREFYQIAKKTKAICQQYQCKLIINDRVDIALSIDADGVHVGQSDMPYGVVRKLLGKHKIIGLSLDSMEDLCPIGSLDLDYIAVSGVFRSSTKNIDSHIWGVDGLRQVSRSIKCGHPIIAIGGINEYNISQISGLCDGFAVVGSICQALDPVSQINKLNQLFLTNK